LTYIELYFLIEKIGEFLSREKKTLQAKRYFEYDETQLEESPFDFGDNRLKRNITQLEQEMMNSNRKVAVEVKNLKKIYKGTKIPALNNISLKIFEKEVFCIIGFNGAGKSTLLNILSGLIKQTEGNRYCNFHDTRSKSHSIGFCSQDNIALPDNTVYENLEFWARIKGVQNIQLEVENVIQRLGLSQSKNSLISAVSIEIRKRICLAISLLTDPQIIILDEPTSGLDPASREMFRGLLAEMKRDQKTVIFTTQYLDDAEHYVDRLAILSEGEIVELDKPERIKQKYASGYTLSISNHLNPKEIDEILQSIIPSGELLSNANLNVLRYAISSGEQHKFSRLFQKLEIIPNLQFNLQKTSLEEAFKRFQNNPKNQQAQNQSSEKFLQTDYKTEFISQLKSVLLQRYYRLIQKKQQIIAAFILPILITVTITYIINQYKKNPELVPIYGLLVGIPIYVNMYLRIYVTSISLEFIINDRDKSKVLQKAMSLKALPYWLGNFLSDFIIHLPLILAGIICELIGLQIVSGPDGKRKTVYYHFINSCFIIVFCYNIIRWFSKKSYSMLVAIVLMFFLSCFMMGETGEAFNSPQNVLMFCLYFIPHLCLAPMPFTNLNINLLATLIHFYFIVDKDSQPSHSKSTQTPLPSQLSTSSSSLLVQQETQRVQQQNSEDYVKMVDCHQVYPKNAHHALKGVTFGLQTGQIFCLLGPNGAGKSTTFHVLANMLPLTSGSASVNSQELYGIPDPKYTPGLCLQSDMLWDYLTVEQNLKIYALMKGIPKENIKENVDELIHALGLELFKDKRVGNLSGGTKRKLSVATAVIGAPKLIILDEPTTGVDPVGRNQIWTLIKNLANKRRSTVLISTHYMEDAELVADKIGILVNGRLKTIGNVLDLRRAEEQHFLTIEGVGSGFVQFLDSKVLEIMPRATLIESSNEEIRTFKVPSAEMRYSEICRHLESMARDKKISGFSINVKTLEQAFLEYAQEQN